MAKKRQFFKAGTVAALHKGVPVKLAGNWDDHTDAVRPQIKKLDRLEAKSAVESLSIVVSNEARK